MEGKHLDRQLEVVPSVQTTWAEWKKAHPGTQVLKKPEEIRSSRYEHYFTDNDRAGMFRTFWLKDRMPAKALVHGVTDWPHALAVPDELVTAGSEHTFDLARARKCCVHEVLPDDGGIVPFCVYNVLYRGR